MLPFLDTSKEMCCALSKLMWNIDILGEGESLLLISIPISFVYQRWAVALLLISPECVSLCLVFESEVQHSKSHEHVFYPPIKQKMTALILDNVEVITKTPLA